MLMINIFINLPKIDSLALPAHSPAVVLMGMVCVWHGSLTNVLDAFFSIGIIPGDIDVIMNFFVFFTNMREQAYNYL